ncbi:hypothetical protein MKX07_003153 [Trichoderma sp. CBMAI-0711]|uniref:Uncharacterized protein n=1 Tax=Trichoderma parareesei TaxID=858221 RepID=A0A2H2YYW2_TRIPA|nr:hypothetical protein MKX07_003153 [Trichoderma sp. CBMAI-0711]OTA01547.1 hypothetical protein A9Z42_0018670 [Trichoderma parareesei]
MTLPQPLPPPAQLQGIWTRHAHNASTTHPVFFTERLRKSKLTSPGPAAAAASGMESSSPVAHGYVYQEARSGANAPKL